MSPGEVIHVNHIIYRCISVCFVEPVGWFTLFGWKMQARAALAGGCRVVAGRGLQVGLIGGFCLPRNYGAACYVQNAAILAVDWGVYF